MKPAPHPTDELAGVRAKIARLRLREGQLRRAIVALPKAERHGRWFHVDIKHSTRAQLNMSGLPPSVLDDPGLYAEISRAVLHCRAIPLSNLILPGQSFGREQYLQ
jgi:hypothetical protein